MLRSVAEPHLAERPRPRGLDRREHRERGRIRCGDPARRRSGPRPQHALDPPERPGRQRTDRDATVQVQARRVVPVVRDRGHAAPRAQPPDRDPPSELVHRSVRFPPSAPRHDHVEVVSPRSLDRGAGGAGIDAGGADNHRRNAMPAERLSELRNDLAARLPGRELCRPGGHDRHPSDPSFPAGSPRARSPSSDRRRPRRTYRYRHCRTTHRSPTRCRSP